MRAKTDVAAAAACGPRLI